MDRIFRTGGVQGCIVLSQPVLIVPPRLSNIDFPAYLVYDIFVQAKKGVTWFVVRLEAFLLLGPVWAHERPSLFGAVKINGTLCLCPNFFNPCDVQSAQKFLDDTPSGLVQQCAVEWGS